MWGQRARGCLTSIRGWSPPGEKRRKGSRERKCESDFLGRGRDQEVTDRRQVERPRRDRVNANSFSIPFETPAGVENGERQESSKEQRRGRRRRRRRRRRSTGPMLKSLRSLSLAAQIDVRPCFTFNSIGQKTLLSVPASPALCAATPSSSSSSSLSLSSSFAPFEGTPRCNR